MPFETTCELRDLRHERLALMSPLKRLTIERAAQQLEANGIGQGATCEGDRAPDFTLADAQGRSIRLQDELQNGPVVVSFYRGGWCPYCNVELRGLQRALPEIQAAGASLLAISPELPDNTLTTAQKNGLSFPVLSDVGNVVAKSFGIVYRLPDELLAVYAASKHDLRELNGEQGAKELPLPATFVLDRQGIVRLAYVDGDYTTRLDPDAILEALAAL